MHEGSPDGGSLCRLSIQRRWHSRVISISFDFCWVLTLAINRTPRILQIKTQIKWKGKKLVQKQTRHNPLDKQPDKPVLLDRPHEVLERIALPASVLVSICCPLPQAERDNLQMVGNGNQPLEVTEQQSSKLTSNKVKHCIYTTLCRLHVLVPRLQDYPTHPP